MQGDGSASDAIFELPDMDVPLALGRVQSRLADGTLIVFAPRELGDRHLWARRWDLEHLRRTSR